MSNSPHRAHKRQKSSILNPGYYFTPDRADHQQQQQHQHVPLKLEPHDPHQHQSEPSQGPQPTPHPSSTQPLQQLQQQHHNVFEQEPYMSYNFPPSSSRTRPSTSTAQQTSELSHESHSVHTSPLKRSASSELDASIPAMAASSPVVSASAGYYYAHQPPQPQPPPPPTTTMNFQDHHQQQQSQTLHTQLQSPQQQQQQLQAVLHSTSSLPLFGNTTNIHPGTSMQPSGSFAYNISHSTTNPSSFDSSNLYNSAFRVPEYPINSNTTTTSSSSLLSATGGKQFQQTSALLPSGTLPPSSLGTSSTSLHVSALRQHQKNNLSISSHLTLFSLSGNNPPPLPPQQPQPQQHPLQHHPQPLQPILSGSSSSEETKRTDKENSAILNELLFNLTSVDGSNINSFLLTMLRKINLPFTLDDFYNLLYNDRQRSLLDNISYQNKIDKTVVSSNTNEMAVDLINQLLNVFKNPNLLIEYFPNLEDKDNKLVNINYHELLRTFLAIKILYDILIQLQLSDEDDPQHYTIPRLSIYKTYYIICQKLIASYPSASNTRNEQQKLILGQSKLGKLIKLVYPNLLIKRLGSRGESKYNYLGVMWNENIVQHEIKQLCEDHDLNDLGEIFNNDHNNPFATLATSSGNVTTSSSPRRGLGHRRNSSKLKLKSENILGNNPFLQPLHSSSSLSQPHQQQQHSQLHQQQHHHHQHPLHPQNISEPSSAVIPQQLPEYENAISAPRLSFVKLNLKYPIDVNFSVLDDNNWFVTLLYESYSRQPSINPSLIQQIFLKNEFLLNSSSLLRNLIDSVIKPLTMEETYPNVDLTLYLIIILEILPYLLLVKSSTNINLLKNLRLNLLHLINNLNGELKKLNSPKFPIERSTIFLILVKKLINLNDLLITFIKLINRDSSKAMMSHDIENFLKISSQTIKMDDDDSNFFFNLNTTSMGEVNFSFKNDILSNDLIYTLIGYNFDPNVNSELRNSISMNFINEEINIIDEFFKNDLLNFLNTDFDTGLGGEVDVDEESGLVIDPTPTQRIPTHGSHGGSLSPEGISTTNASVPPIRNTSMTDAQAANKQVLTSSSSPSSSGNEAVLTLKEMVKLNSLLSLIDKRLLSNQFKSKYPILMYNNCITYILNDILKFIFLKQQQQQLQSTTATGGANTGVPGSSDTQQDPIPGSSTNNGSNNSFGNWWVFNSFIQEYMSLMGEIVGLHDSLQ